MSSLLRSLLAISFVLASIREPVLKQIQLPHSYYWREMYLPQLTSGPSSAAWSPDGASVVYPMKGSLWRQTLGSDEAVEITHGPGYDYQPDWSPDSRAIVFVRHERDAIHLMRLDLATGREQALTQGDEVDLEPRISPDGQRIVFVSSRETGHFDLYIAGLNAAGLTNVRPLVAGRVSTLDRYYYSPSDHAINPSWSPDGKRVLYVGNPEIAWGTGDLWSVATDNPEDRTHILTEETTCSARPELAHDGKRLLYASYQGRAWIQLWLTTPEGRSPFPLTFGDFDRRNARWSPDDARILYISNEGGNTSLWQQTVLGGARSEIKAKTLRWKQPMAPLALSLTDDKRSPLPGRVSVLAADGRYYAPDDAWIHGDDNFDRSLQSQETRYFHCPAHCTVTVPVGGAVTLTATHGFAHTPAIQTVQAGASGAAATLNLAINDLPARFGPHLSADLHVHMNYGGHYRQHQEGLAAQAAAEDLDVVYNLVVNKEQRIPDLTEFSTIPRTIGGVTIFQGQEFHTSYWGHLGLLHLNDHFLTPDFAAYRHTAMASAVPTNGMIADLAHAQGALVGYVHPFDDPIVPEKEKSLSHALPVDVALGRTDYLEIVSFEQSGRERGGMVPALESRIPSPRRSRYGRDDQLRLAARPGRSQSHCSPHHQPRSGSPESRYQEWARLRHQRPAARSPRQRQGAGRNAHVPLLGRHGDSGHRPTLHRAHHGLGDRLQRPGDSTTDTAARRHIRRSHSDAPDHHQRMAARARRQSATESSGAGSVSLRHHESGVDRGGGETAVFTGGCGVFRALDRSRDRKRGGAG